MHPKKSANSLPDCRRNTPNTLKIFISYKDETGRVLASEIHTELRFNPNFNVFAACKDISVGDGSEEQILGALRAMDVLISVHTTGFSQSLYCQQEVGTALGREVPIIPLMIDEKPEGLISKINALDAKNLSAVEIVSRLTPVIEKHYKDKILAQPTTNDNVCSSNAPNAQKMRNENANDSVHSSNLKKTRDSDAQETLHEAAKDRKSGGDPLNSELRERINGINLLDLPTMRMLDSPTMRMIERNRKLINGINSPARQILDSPTMRTLRQLQKFKT